MIHESWGGGVRALIGDPVRAGSLYARKSMSLSGRSVPMITGSHALSQWDFVPSAEMERDSSRRALVPCLGSARLLML